MKNVRSIGRYVRRTTVTLLLLAISTMSALAADPGALYPTTSDVSDQKMGSLLFFNYYTSSSCCPGQENTRINITNTHQSANIMVHLFFVDGTTCSVADSFLPLVRNQTSTFVLSDIDPGVMGYLVAVAVEGPNGFTGGANTGRPLSFNWLIGDQYVEMASGHQANLGAETFAVIDDMVGGAPVPKDPFYAPGSPTANLTFNGTTGNYNRAPQLLALSSMPSPADGIAGYNTQIVLNRIGGSLVGSATPIGPLFGLMYNDASMQLSFTFSSTSCQFRSQINRNFPRTTPRPNVLIPEGRTGWAKFYSMSENVGLLGAVMITNNSSASSNSLSLGVETLNGGRNLHKLRLANTVQYEIPVFPPN
ncbi:MAG: hypothetical protein RIR52_647 [Acidobacteriota bacterium]